jgi:hypothetical protein
MLFTEIIVVYYEKDMKRANTCGKSAEFLYVTAGGTSDNNWALKGQHA